MAANWNESIYNENGVCNVLLWLVMRYRWAMRSMAVSTSSIIVAMQICQWITYRMVITVQIWLIINSPITRQRLGNILCKFYLELTYSLRNHFYALLIKKKARLTGTKSKSRNWWFGCNQMGHRPMSSSRLPHLLFQLVERHFYFWQSMDQLTAYESNQLIKWIKTISTYSSRLYGSQLSSHTLYFLFCWSVVSHCLALLKAFDITFHQILRLSRKPR